MNRTSKRLLPSGTLRYEIARRLNRIARSIVGTIHYRDRVTDTKRHIVKAAKLVLKPGTRKFRFARKIAMTTGLISSIALDTQYQEWIERTEPYSWSELLELTYRPKISVIVPVYNPPAKYFLPMVYSMINQTYENWELILVNASTDSQCRKQTSESRHIDNRIKVIDLDNNKGIAGNTNAGIKHVTSDYIGLLDHDDLLAPAALYEVVLALQDNKATGIIYSDEDKISADGEERSDPHFKPDWSPQLLRELNYLNHFTVIKTSLITKIGGYRPGFEGAQDYDLFLRAVDETPEIIHIPKILYHWRTTETSTARNFSKKKGVLNAGIRAVEDHLVRNKLKGKVTALKKQPGFYKICYATNSEYALALIITPGSGTDQYQNLVETIAINLQSASYDFELYSQELQNEPRLPTSANMSLRYIKENKEESFIEVALSLSQAKTCVIISGGITPTTTDWLKELSGVVEQVQEIGAVIPLITTTDQETIFDAGYVDHAGESRAIFKGYPKGMHTYFGNTDWVRNLNTLSGRCFAIRTDLLSEYLDEAGANKRQLDARNMSEFITAKNLQLVLWPFTRFTYRGDMSQDVPATQYFSPALTFTKEEFSLPKTINIPRPEINDD